MLAVAALTGRGVTTDAASTMLTKADSWRALSLQERRRSWIGRDKLQSCDDDNAAGVDRSNMRRKLTGRQMLHKRTCRCCVQDLANCDAARSWALQRGAADGIVPAGTAHSIERRKHHQINDNMHAKHHGIALQCRAPVPRVFQIESPVQCLHAQVQHSTARVENHC